MGATIHYPQSRSQYHTDDIDVVVYTAAIHPDNPEFAAVKAANIPMLTRAELLGELMQNYKMPIAVSGTHGKTTTTSMLSHILMGADMDPTISVGGILPSIGGNVRDRPFRRILSRKPVNIRTASFLCIRRSGYHPEH